MPEHNRPGDVLADRYRLTDLLNESAGGRFWRAFDKVLKRDVAVHIIPCDDDRAPGDLRVADLARQALDLIEGSRRWFASSGSRERQGEDWK